METIHLDGVRYRARIEGERKQHDEVGATCGSAVFRTSSSQWIGQAILEDRDSKKWDWCVVCTASRTCEKEKLASFEAEFLGDEMRNILVVSRARLADAIIAKLFERCEAERTRSNVLPIVHLTIGGRSNRQPADVSINDLLSGGIVGAAVSL